VTESIRKDVDTQVRAEPGLRGRDILLLSSDDYEAGLKTSKHQLTECLSRHNRILFVESVGLRRPAARAKDLGRIRQKVARFVAGPQKRADNLWVYTPLAIPLHQRPLVRAFNDRFVSFCIRRAAQTLGFCDPLLWIFLPTVAGVAGRCGERLLLYYCVDDFAQFTGSDVAVINALDRELTCKSDVVFASAESLADRKRILNPNTHYIPHGVDVEHFRRAVDGMAVPADIADLRGPVITYWGWISDYFDQDAVADMATTHPEWNILLIGESTVDLSWLRSFANVRILGTRPYETLPGYAARSDVLLILRKVTALTRSMNPLKLREYLATGRPVVSSPLPEVQACCDTKYKGAVTVAESPHGVTAAVEAFLASATPERAARIAALVADESWEVRLTRISREILAVEAQRDARQASNRVRP